MKLESVCKIKGGRQDGAINNGFFFSFNHLGECTVYKVDSLERGEGEAFSEFVLDKVDLIKPHSNSVTFGSEYYDKDDEFPLLYTNVYNNYANSEDKLKGVCLVYRLQRQGNKFESTMVQMIRIDFTEDSSLWKSAEDKEDVRPYGNFAVDADRGLLYAFTMRDNTNSTRYFSFHLPEVSCGEPCEKYDVNKVVLTKEDVLDFFDCDYHRYVQGACCHNGKVYSLEGFTDSVDNPPAIRIIDTKLRKEIIYKRFKELGTNVEPEMIDFCEGVCYYGDHNGNIYKLTE